MKLDCGDFIFMKRMDAVMSNDITKIFADRLQDELEKCKECGKTFSAVADDLGISTGALSNYQNDNAEAKISTLKRMATYFGVSCDYLLGGAESPNTENEEIRKKIGLSEKSIKKLNDLKIKMDNDSSISEHVIEAINMLLSVEGMEGFFIDTYLFMWRFFDENVVFKKNHLNLWEEEYTLTPDKLEKILLLSMQTFMIEARDKIVEEHDSKVDRRTKAAWKIQVKELRKMQEKRNERDGNSNG